VPVASITGSTVVALQPYLDFRSVMTVVQVGTMGDYYPVILSYDKQLFKYGQVSLIEAVVNTVVGTVRRRKLGIGK
jgi:hypothetical protein